MYIRTLPYDSGRLDRLTSTPGPQQHSGDTSGDELWAEGLVFPFFQVDKVAAALPFLQQVCYYKVGGNGFVSRSPNQI